MEDHLVIGENCQISEPKYDLNIMDVITIKPDGTIEKGPAFTTQDEASKAFWDAISYYFPKWKESCK